MKSEPKNMIEIPTIDPDKFEKNLETTNQKNMEHCPCCGKPVLKSIYFINSIYGGFAYPADDKTIYPDSWKMAVGPECRKKFPKNYIIKSNN